MVEIRHSGGGGGIEQSRRRRPRRPRRKERALTFVPSLLSLHSLSGPFVRKKGKEGFKTEEAKSSSGVCVSFPPPFFRTSLQYFFFFCAASSFRKGEEGAKAQKSRENVFRFRKQTWHPLSFAVAGIGGRRGNKIDVACPPRGGEGPKGGNRSESLLKSCTVSRDFGSKEPAKSVV